MSLLIMNNKCIEKKINGLILWKKNDISFLIYNVPVSL